MRGDILEWNNIGTQEANLKPIQQFWELVGIQALENYYSQVLRTVLPLRETKLLFTIKDTVTGLILGLGEL